MIDVWTSPNHKAFIVITACFKSNSKAICILLDVVKVVQSHSGLNLAAVFMKVLKDFRLSGKVIVQHNFLK